MAGDSLLRNAEKLASTADLPAAWPGKSEPDAV
jgi:hypothetical protein